MERRFVVVIIHFSGPGGAFGPSVSVGLCVQAITYYLNSL